MTNTRTEALRIIRSLSRAKNVRPNHIITTLMGRLHIGHANASYYYYRVYLPLLALLDDGVKKTGVETETKTTEAV